MPRGEARMGPSGVGSSAHGDGVALVAAAVRAAAEAKVPCGAVFNTQELMHDTDLHARGVMTKVDHPQRGEVIVSGWPLNMSDSKVPIKSSPLHGEHNEDIYGDWLGYSAEEVKAMRERDVI